MTFWTFWGKPFIKKTLTASSASIHPKGTKMCQKFCFKVHVCFACSLYRLGGEFTRLKASKGPLFDIDVP